MTSLDYSKLKGRTLFIATPCYGDRVTVPYMRSILDLMKQCRKYGVIYMHYTLSTESLVTRARNSCVAAFLSQDGNDGNVKFDTMIFIDSDISFNPKDVFRLMLHDKEIVGGVYPKKRIDLKRLIEFTEQGNETPEPLSLDYVMTMLKQDEHKIVNGLMEVEEIGTGFLMIKRSVFEDMIEKYGNSINYKPLVLVVGQKPENFYSFFHTDIDPETNHYLSEDYFFVKRWIRDFGGKVYADIEIPLTHVGVMKFEGSFQTLLKIK
jgi:hypothetical protein